MKYAGETTKGRREHNEDSFFIPQGGEVPLVIVADGMGGHRGGAIASDMAVKTLLRAIRRGGMDTPPNIITRAVEEANSEIFNYSMQNKECRGMGTTAVLAMAFRSHYIAANIGDSRLYHYSGGGLKQVTRDHSYVEELVAAGYITREQAAVHPRRNIITRALGSRTCEGADIFTMHWQRGDKLLLCSDGLYSALSEKDMARILGEEERLSAACSRLIEEAYYGGSTDNITAVLVYNEEEGC